MSEATWPKHPFRSDCTERVPINDVLVKFVRENHFSDWDGRNPDWICIRELLQADGKALDQVPTMTTFDVRQALMARLVLRLGTAIETHTGEVIEPIDRRKPAKPKKRPRTSPRKTTPKQLEAIQMVGECKGNFAEAARKLSKDPKTIRQLYKAGLRNAGDLAATLKSTPKKQRLPTDRRGQISVARDRRG